MFEKLRQNLSRLIAPAKNSMNLAQDYLKYGAKVMTPDWTQVVMREEDLYTGYSYAAIRNRANAVAQIAISHIKTDSKKEGLEHPYLEVIESSPTFTDYQFWYNISTYLDLEGVFYLMAIRNFQGSRFGDIKEFKLLNPYRIRRVIDPATLEVAGYVETKGGLVREIPKEMIIEMRELNPFDENKNYAMTDAAKESQFTMKTAGDYTRHTLKHNINAPGILTTDVALADEEFENFAARVKKNTKGEPIFGNGKGSITWNAMNIDLSKSALGDVNEVNQQQLFSIAGVSKTIMGIEQSGTTRETANVQRDLMVGSQTIPRIQLVIDALNQDYRNHYPQEYATTDVDICVDNPTKTDHDSDIKATQVRQSEFDLYTSLIDSGYDPVLSAKYVNGEIGIEEIGEPDPTKVKTVTLPAATQVEDPNNPGMDMAGNPMPAANSLKKKDHTHLNARSKAMTASMKRQESYLKNSVINVDKRIVANVISKLEKTTNAYEVISDLITARDKNLILSELELVLKTFYTTNIAEQGSAAMKRRAAELKLLGTFTFDNLTKKYVRELSEKVSESHVDAVLGEMLTTTRQGALEGLSQKQLANNVRQKYSAVGENSATAVARTETNRAFTRAQYEADRQMIEQNDLQGRAYKTWVTRSANPCVYCQSLEDEGPIPFDEPFVDLGGSITVGDKSLAVDFESLEAGNAHTNCSCEYKLVIQPRNSLETENGIIKEKLENSERQRKEVDTIIEQVLKDL